MRLRTIVFAVASLAISFFASLWIMDRLSPESATGETRMPALAQMQPLPPAAQSSVVLAPVTITLNSIRDAIERAAPKTFSGKVDNPAPQLIQNSDINWTATRGAIAASGASNTIAVSTTINGTVNAKGSLSQEAGGALSGLAGLLGGSTGDKLREKIGRISVRQINANADIGGNVTMQSRPQLSANWRVDPSLSAQVALADTSLNLSGVPLRVTEQLRPTLDRLVNQQVGILQDRVRNDPMLEQTARREWVKMCRSIPLPAAAPGLPELFLEMKPTKAIAAQPAADAANVRLFLGIEAQTTVTTAQTKPDCPFPAALEIVPPRDQGSVRIGVPIDMPFTDVNRIIGAQLNGKTFPEDGSGAVTVTVKSAKVAPSGEKLLISLLVSGQEKKSWFGMGGDATVHVWGRPVLDQKQQTLKLTDIELAVESEAAFGLLGAAARAAMPYVQSALAERATIDLKPFAADARAKISAAMADLRKSDNGIKVDAAITEVRLAAVAWDSTTLRIIAEANGSINVAVTQLPGL